MRLMPESVQELHSPSATRKPVSSTSMLRDELLPCDCAATTLQAYEPCKAIARLSVSASRHENDLVLTLVNSQPDTTMNVNCLDCR
jgi:hypothetical protein